jgi:hypothetical protein
MFSLSVFALMGLQIYMGVLTQKCVKEFPDDGSWGNLTHENWHYFCSNDCKYQRMEFDILFQLKTNFMSKNSTLVF